MNKIVKRLSMLTLAVAVAGAGAIGMAAYEAHIINVTAKIENALSVSPTHIDFGTVFPQEELDRNVDIALSESFINEGRVDDVKYTIKQKPKVKACEASDCEPGNPDGDPYATIYPSTYSNGIVAHKYCLENLPYNAPYTYNPSDEYWTYCYLPLANYLSKHKDSAESGENDTEVDAPHYAYMWNSGKSSLNPAYIVSGYLSKVDEDISDRWVIDLKVPCFAGGCDQDPNMEQKWWLPTNTESEVFGTDLWIEITEISVNYIDRVDIGNPASESGHALAGWGPIEPDTNGGNWGGCGLDEPYGCDLRAVYAYEEGEGTNNEGAKDGSFTLDFGMDTGAKTLVLNVLDGGDVDDFTVEIDGVQVYDYDALGGGENWVEHSISVTGYTSLHTIRIVSNDYNTPSTWDFFSPYGHLGVDWAEVRTVE